MDGWRASRLSEDAEKGVKRTKTGRSGDSYVSGRSALAKQG